MALSKPSRMDGRYGGDEPAMAHVIGRFWRRWLPSFWEHARFGCTNDQPAITMLPSGAFVRDSHAKFWFVQPVRTKPSLDEPSAFHTDLKRPLMKRRRRATSPLPFLIAELTVFSWETFAHRSAMMMQGACTMAEYQRMVLEKVRAAQLSGIAILFGRGRRAALAPWHRTVRANARRLRG
jgi:hypothetical protein